MQIRLSNFVLDEKDLFVFAFGIFLVVAFLLKLTVAPFRFESLVVVFLFLLVSRGLVNSLKFFSFLMIAVFGLVFSTFLSPYGLLIYFVIVTILYHKTNIL